MGVPAVPQGARRLLGCRAYGVLLGRREARQLTQRGHALLLLNNTCCRVLRDGKEKCVVDECVMSELGAAVSVLPPAPKIVAGVHYFSGDR